jgi:hypothetical protein
MKNLTEKSLLVSLIISQWSARKYDRKATAEVNDAHNAKDAGRFNKILIAKESLQEIQQIGNKARAFHYDNTLPWSDTGERMLPVANYFQYVQEIVKLKGEFESAVAKFILSYPSMIETAKIDLNGLFNEKDYPLNIAERFTITTSFMPVPDIEDVRISLSEVEVNVIKNGMRDEMNERFVNAQKSIYERVKEQLTHMQERLKDKEASFKNSLFENLKPLIELLPRLNVSNDPQIFALATELNYLYVDPQAVRDSSSLRSDKAKEVENMLNKINSFLTPQ